MHLVVILVFISLPGFGSNFRCHRSARSESRDEFEVSAIPTAKDDEVVHLRRRVAQLEAELRKHRMYFGRGSFLTHESGHAVGMYLHLLSAKVKIDTIRVYNKYIVRIYYVYPCVCVFVYSYS